MTVTYLSLAQVITSTEDHHEGGTLINLGPSSLVY